MGTINVKKNTIFAVVRDYLYSPAAIADVGNSSHCHTKRRKTKTERGQGGSNFGCGSR
jgi:hypothetical protein